MKNRTVIVTGGASGIGLAVAKGFAAEGAHVAIWDVSLLVMDVAKGIAEQFKVKSIGLQTDISILASVVESFNQSVDYLGTIEHLVHCAAIGSGKFGFPFTNLEPSDWNRVLVVNIMGMTNIAHVVTPHFVSKQNGSMVFVSSIAGQIGSQTDPPYSASKAANINFAQCMAKDLAGHGIRINTVCPGMVQTTLNRSVWKSWYDQVGPSEQLTYEEWADRKIKLVTPLGKWQTPDAIADMIVFLSSDRCEHVTGQTINVDGGQVMHW